MSADQVFPFGCEPIRCKNSSIESDLIKLLILKIVLNWYLF